MKKNTVKTVPKSWGKELWIENNKDYCCKVLTVVDGKRCSLHYHKEKKETFLVNKGSLRVLCCDLDKWDKQAPKLILPAAPASFETLAETGVFEEFILNKGESLTLEQFTLHTFTAYDCEYNRGGWATTLSCEFIETSTHHKDSDSHRIMI